VHRLVLRVGIRPLVLRLESALQARRPRVLASTRKVTLQARPLEVALQAWRLKVALRAQDLNALQRLRVVLQAWTLNHALQAQSLKVALRAQDLSALQTQRLNSQGLKLALRTQILLMVLQTQGLNALQAQSLRLVLRTEGLRVPPQVLCRPLEESLLHRVVPLERCRALCARHGCHQRRCLFISCRPIATFLPFAGRQFRTFIMMPICWGTSPLFTSTLDYLGMLMFLISREASKDTAFCHSRLHVLFPPSVSENLLAFARATCAALSMCQLTDARRWFGE